MAVLSKDPRGQQFLEGHRCMRFQACSFTRIISSDDEIEAAWVREKAEDGRTYQDFPMPSLKGRDLSGNPVQADDLNGRPTVVALLSLHCNHSIESLPILTELAERFRAERVRVVGVFVNSGGTEEVNYWVPQLYPDYDSQYEVWVADDTSIGDAANSHLTPTYLIVDAQGQVQKKLVGFKSEDDVRNELVAALHLGGSRVPAR
jgi:thiol-disulfide isomerase/thioredoxin